MNPPSYRNRIWERYATCFQDAPASFDVAAADRWGRSYAYYLRHWLPCDQKAAIADLACGGGKLLHFFKARGYQRVRGVDISPEQVQLARQVLPDVTQADALEFLHDSPSSYEMLTGLDLVEHLTKEEVLRFLDRCFSALKPRGRLILQTPNAESPWGSALRYGDVTHEVCFTPNALSRLLRLCGFVDVEVREQGPVPLGYSCKSTIRFILWQLIRLGLKTCNLAETGGAGSGTLTRNFLVSARKP